MGTLILCLDISESMAYGEPSKLKQAVQASLKAVSGLSSDDQLGLVTFETDVEVVLDIQPFNPEKTQDQLRSLSVRGASRIAKGLAEAVDLLKEKHLGGRLLLLTDGRANLSLNLSGGFEGNIDLEAELLKICQRTHSRNVAINTISVGEDAFTHTLSTMAERAQGLHCVAEAFQGIGYEPKGLRLKSQFESLGVHAAPVELPSAQPSWTKESQFMHAAVVSQNIYEAYLPSRTAFLSNPHNKRKARTALISIQDQILATYRERRPKTVREIGSNEAILLDRSYRDYLDLSEKNSVEVTIYTPN